MASSTGESIIDWAEVSKYVNLFELMPHLRAEQVIEAIGVERAVQAIGPQRVIEALGKEELLETLLMQLPPEKVQEALRRRQQDAGAKDEGNANP